MIETDIIETEFLVLRTVQYGEGNLMCTGLSPSHGRLSFAVRGGYTSPRKGTSPFGLFRRLQIGYQPRDRDVQTCTYAEIVADYATLSVDYKRYECACWLSQFSLANIMPNMASEYYFKSVILAFERLVEGVESIVAIQTGILMVYLEENGLLPVCEENSRQAKQCQILLDMALGEAVPALKPENWLALRDWAVSLLQTNDCFVPQAPV